MSRLIAGEGRRRWLRSFDRRPAPLFGNGGFVAFPFYRRAPRTLGRQLLLRRSVRFLELQSLCIDSLHDLVSCKTLMA